MQPTHYRLLQCIRTTFNASRPRSFSSVNIQRREHVCKIQAQPSYHRLFQSRAGSLEKDPLENEPAPSAPNSPTESPPSPLPPSSTRLTTLLSSVPTTLSTLSTHLNTLSGYNAITALKTAISSQEHHLRDLRSSLSAARITYTSSVSTRSRSQRSLNDLLHRKHTWTPSDLEEFTALYRAENAQQDAEADAQRGLEQAERALEDAAERLGKMILERYHEEQVWSDKIRYVSTWGTWVLVGVNVCLFLVFQVAVEPWRRERLVLGFEDRVRVALQKEKEKNRTETGEMGSGPALIDGAAPEEVVVDHAISPFALEAARETVDAAHAIEEAAARDVDRVGVSDSFAEPKAGFAYYEDAFRELFSERRVVMVQRDVTAVVLQGAAGGAAVMGILLVLLRPR